MIFFQFQIQCRLLFGTDRAGQGRTQLRIQCQHRGQGAVAVDQGVQGIGVQRQLLIGAGGVFLQRLTLGVADGQGRGKDGTGDDQQGVQRQTQGTGSRQHAGANGWQDGRAPYHADARLGVLFAPFAVLRGDLAGGVVMCTLQKMVCGWLASAETSG